MGRSESEGLDRRDFLKVAAATAMGAAGSAAAQAPPAAQGSGAAAPFIGIQMGPHTILDEGIDRVLDLIQETARVNAVLVYSHAYNDNLRKPANALANDHGVPVRDNRSRNYPLIWVKAHEGFYKDTTLRHQPVTGEHEYAGRDLFAELAEPCRKRGIKLYARVLESAAMARVLPNFSKVVTQDIHGKPTTTACWNHPEYIAFWCDTMEDLFRSYALDGIQWGAERQGPLMNVICPWNNAAPTCFCEHCRARGKAAGIDAERARKGYEELYDYCQARMDPRQPKPADGIFVGFLRVLLRYPEILAWEYQYRLGREAIYQAMHKRVKGVNPLAQVGWHVDHQPTSWDLVYRAEMSYEEMAPYSDFIKIIAYHAVLGPRIRNWYLARFQRTILGELPLEDSLAMYYDVFGYDKAAEPGVAELARKGFSPEYVFRETKRSVASANGKTRIYTGVGFDVPDSPPDDDDTIYHATLRAFDAGASGIVISREYEEMRVPHLQAVGKAMREVAKPRIK